MQIAISGTFSVGKTTLLDKIKDSGEFNDFTLIREVVRTLAKQGIQINKGADVFSQTKILEQHLKNALSYDNMISDRCAVDAFVFATYDYLKGNYSYDDYKKFEAIFLDAIKSYNKLFYIPIEFDIVDDNFRSLDKEYQKDIDSLFKMIFKRYNLSYIELKGTVKERFNLFRAYA